MSLHLKDPPTTDYLTKSDNIYSDLCAALDRYKGGQILSSWLRISQFYLIVKHVEQPLNIHFFTHLLYPCCSREFQGLGECHYKCSAPTTCFCSICKRLKVVLFSIADLVYILSFNHCAKYGKNVGMLLPSHSPIQSFNRCNH